MATAELEVELPGEDIAFLEAYAERHRISLSNLVSRYVAALRAAPHRPPHPANLQFAGTLPGQVDGLQAYRQHMATQSPISDLPSPISHLRSPISDLPSPISHLRSPIPDLPSPISHPPPSPETDRLRPPEIPASKARNLSSTTPDNHLSSRAICQQYGSDPIAFYG